MKERETEMCLCHTDGGVKTGKVAIKGGTFQGDSLSPLLFWDLGGSISYLIVVTSWNLGGSVSGLIVATSWNLGGSVSGPILVIPWHFPGQITVTI